MSPSVLLLLIPPSMIKLSLRRSTRSIYLGLACLSLALHLLLALFCLSILQTACVLPTSSSSTERTGAQHHQSISRSYSSSDASSTITLPPDEQRHKPDVQSSYPKERDSPTERGKKLIGSIGKVVQKVEGHSKLESLFKHRLYNIPHPELQEDDWLLRVKTDEHPTTTESEEEEQDEAIDSDSQW